MPRARFLSFDGPDRFEATFRTGNFELLELPESQFSAEPTRSDFTTGPLTYGSARTASSAVQSGARPARVRVMFLADTAHAMPLQNGMKLSAQELVVRPLRAIDDSRGPVRAGGSHARIIARFEEFLATRQFQPVYLAQVCAAIGTPERTLRTCCQEQLGMGPIHYHWLRRMNLARRALVDGDPARTTVTEIATKHGFSELGRFSVEYRALFGESPSASLRRRSRDEA